MRERIGRHAPQVADAPSRRRRAADPDVPTGAGALSALQRSAGNQAVVQLLRDGGSSDLPAPLRAGIEQLSGTSLEGVRVHRSSPKPAEIGAAAFTAGDDIHIGPGNEADLSHEAWHVVQQREGRVPRTGSVGGTAVNLDARLETEADQMAARADSTSPTADRTPVRRAAPSSPVVQGRWLIFTDGPDTGYFWEDEADVAKGPRPEMWARFREIVPSGPYSVDQGPRYVPLAYTEATYRQLYASSAREAVPNDVFNPFGRMNNTTTISTYLPADPRIRDQVLGALAAKDKTYRPIRAVSERLANGFPNSVQVEGSDEWLRQTGTSLLGASYGNGTASATGDAVADAARGANAARLALNPPPSEPWKFASRSNIDASIIKFYSGRDRGESQAAVMGESAGDVAANAGYEKNEGKGWEWLHLIAHSMGGVDVDGPQVAGNLVVGTSECNSQMIVVEEFLKDVILRYPGVRARLIVMAEMIDLQRHIASRIKYDFLVFPPGGKDAVAVFHWTFDPLSRLQPMVTENRQTRYAGRAMFGGDTTFQAPPKPKPLPPDEPVSFLESVDAERLAELLQDPEGASHLMTAPPDELMGLVGSTDRSDDRCTATAIDAALAEYGMHRRTADAWENICLIDSIHQLLGARGIALDRNRLIDVVRQRTGTAAWQMLDLIGAQGQQVLAAVHDVVQETHGRNVSLVAHVMAALPDGSVVPIWRANHYQVQGGEELDLDLLFVNNNHFEPLFES